MLSCRQAGRVLSALLLLSAPYLPKPAERAERSEAPCKLASFHTLFLQNKHIAAERAERSDASEAPSDLSNTNVYREPPVVKVVLLLPKHGRAERREASEAPFRHWPRACV